MNARETHDDTWPVSLTVFTGSIGSSKKNQYLLGGTFTAVAVEHTVERLRRVAIEICDSDMTILHVWASSLYR